MVSRSLPWSSPAQARLEKKAPWVLMGACTVTVTEGDPSTVVCWMVMLSTLVRLYRFPTVLYSSKFRFRTLSQLLPDHRLPGHGPGHIVEGDVITEEHPESTHGNQDEKKKRDQNGKFDDILSPLPFHGGSPFRCYFSTVLSKRHQPELTPFRKNSCASRSSLAVKLIKQSTDYPLDWVLAVSIRLPALLNTLLILLPSSA